MTTATIIVVINDAKAQAMGIFCCHRIFPRTTSNQTATSNRPSCAHNCYGVPPNSNHANHHCFFCRSIDIGDDARHPPPLLRACHSTLVASSCANPCWKKRCQQVSPCDLDWYLDILVKHTTVDYASDCLSRRHIVKMLYFQL